MSSISDINRLQWRCRRGMREMDLLLGGYLEQCYAQADPELQQAFIDILDEIDQDILDWVMQRQPCPPRYVRLIHELQQFSSLHKPGSN